MAFRKTMPLHLSKCKESPHHRGDPRVGDQPKGTLPHDRGRCSLQAARAACAKANGSGRCNSGRQAQATTENCHLGGFGKSADSIWLKVTREIPLLHSPPSTLIDPDEKKSKGSPKQQVALVSGSESAKKTQGPPTQTKNTRSPAVKTL